VMAFKLLHECNYLQGNEGNIDLTHVGFLHYTRGSREPYVERLNLGDSVSRGRAPGKERMEGKIIEYGLLNCRITTLDAETIEYRVGTFILPNLCATPGGQTNWHVPINDRRHWKFTFVFDYSAPLDREKVRGSRAVMDPEYQSVWNASNRYGQDRRSMVNSFSGMGRNFQVHDLCVTERMGPISDRTQEHLVASDQPIIAARHLLLRAIRTVQEGGDPPGVFCHPEDNSFKEVVTSYGLLPATTDWKDHCKMLVARGGAWESQYFRQTHGGGVSGQQTT
jgi:hypothetical protein